MTSAIQPNDNHDTDEPTGYNPCCCCCGVIAPVGAILAMAGAVGLVKRYKKKNA